MENIEESSPLRITPTVRALSSALRGKRENVPDSSRENGDRIFPEPEKLWFKESSAKNLRTRDFLSPTTMLNTLYADGQVSLTDTCWVLQHFNWINAHFAAFSVLPISVNETSSLLKKKKGKKKTFEKHESSQDTFNCNVG